MTPDPTPREISDDLDIWRTAFGKRMDILESRIDDNTETTKRVETNTEELVDILRSWKGAMKVFEFLGKVAKPLAAIGGLVAAVLTWRHSK